MHNYDSTPVYDSHLHNMVSRPIDETVWCFENVMKHFNYKKIVLNGLPTYNYADNWVAFYCKSQKTPRREIEKAKSERDDYLSRKER